MLFLQRFNFARTSALRACRSSLPLLVASLVCVAPAVHGQALVTASRIGELQAGGGYSVATSDYGSFHLKGPSFYASYDIRQHWGVEVDFHQLNSPNSVLYERTYEVGGRYLTRSFGPMHPYAKGMYGRGVANLPVGVTAAEKNILAGNIAYNEFVGGGGVDFHIRPWLNARVDVEYQRWLSGPLLDHGLTPLVGTVGVAYRFGSYKLNGRQWVLSAPKPEKPSKAAQNAPFQRQPLPAPSPEQPAPAHAQDQPAPAPAPPPAQ